MRYQPGCISCIITIQCRTEIEIDDFFIKADRESCVDEPQRLHLTLAQPLQMLFDFLPPTPPLEDIQNLKNRQLTLFTAVQTQIAPQIKIPHLNKTDIEILAQPILASLTEEASPSLPHEVSHLSSPYPANYIVITSVVASLLIQVLVNFILAKKMHGTRSVCGGHSRAHLSHPSTPETAIEMTPLKPQTPNIVINNAAAAISKETAFMFEQLQQHCADGAATAPHYPGLSV